MNQGPDEPGQATALSDEFRRLVLRSLRGNVNLMRKLTEIGRRVREEPRAGPAGVDDLFNRLVQFNIEYYTLLNEYSQTFARDLLGLVEQSLVGQKPAPQHNGAVRAPQLQLIGRPGETATGAFIVNNSFSAPVALSFSIGDFRSPDGQILSAAGVAFEPSAPTLAPGADRTIVVSVAIGPQFQPGMDYTSYIRVEGYRTQELSVLLRVEAAAARQAADRSADIAVSALGLSTRITRALEGQGIGTLAELRNSLAGGDSALLTIPGIGPKSVEEIRAVVALADRK